MKTLDELLRDQAGATAIEYALIAALISVAALTAISTLNDQVMANFESVGKKFSETTTRK